MVHLPREVVNPSPTTMDSAGCRRGGIHSRPSFLRLSPQDSPALHLDSFERPAPQALKPG